MSRVPTFTMLAVGAVAMAGIAAMQLDLDLSALLTPPVEKSPTVKAPVPLARTAALADLAAGLGVAGGKDASTPVQSETAAFDVARVSPEGISVFAGRAAPNAQVTVMANGRPLTSVKADANGEWSAITDSKLASGTNQLSLSVRKSEGEAPVAGQSISVDVAASTRAVPDGASTRPGPVGASLVRVAAASPRDAQTAVSPGPTPPITFNFREATMTSEGRRAAALLADHLRQQRLEVATLSGHADERGSDQHNMELSRQRLDVVAQQLRSAGFTGRLVLLPKGKSEPYAEVDRRQLPRDQVFQLDRRVQLRSN